VTRRIAGNDGHSGAFLDAYWNAFIAKRLCGERQRSEGAMGLGPVIGVAMAALAGAAAILAAEGTPDGFDQAGWKAQHDSTAIDNPRAGMVVAVEEHLKPGMSRDEVLALLGPAESENGGTLTYDLGASPYGIDFDYLVIEFDAKGRLTRHYITRS
jgi:hypothetical protein